MSAITSTVPFLLKIDTLPSAESCTSTLFGVAGAPGNQLRFEASGRSAASVGHSVRKLAAVPLTVVTFIAIALAVDGTMHPSPLVPCTSTSIAVSGPIGADTGPMLSSPGRVSINRHGTIGTNADWTPLPAPETNCAPAKAATTRPPTAAKPYARFI